MTAAAASEDDGIEKGESEPLLSKKNANNNNGYSNNNISSNNGIVSKNKDAKTENVVETPASPAKQENEPASAAAVDPTPSWSEMLRQVVPYLRPVDRKHFACAVVSLVMVILGKLVGVLPPLAIKYAVDAVAKNAKLADLSLPESTTAPANTTTESLQKEESRPILYALLLYFLLKLLSMTMNSLKSVTQRIVSLDAMRRFSVASFSHLHHLSLSYHLEKHIGEITLIMNRGTESISSMIDAFVFSLAPTAFETVVVSAVFWKLGTPLVAVSTLGSVAVYFAFTFSVTNTRVKYRREVIDASDAVGQKETETLVNYETVQMFGRTDDEISMYAALRQTYKTTRVKLLSMFTLLEFGQSFIRQTGVCFGLVLAGYATVYGDPPLSPGGFVVVQLYINQLFQPLTYLGFTYQHLTQAFTNLEKVVVMLNRVPEVADAPDAVVWESGEEGSNNAKDAAASGEIVFDNVSFHYKQNSRKRPLGASLVSMSKGGRRGGGGGRHAHMHGGGFGGGGRAGGGGVGGGRKNTIKQTQSQKSKDEINDTHDPEAPPPSSDNDEKNKSVAGGVNNLTFTIPAGKTVALVGRSGSGKTTIIRLVLRMYDPDAGSVSIEHRDVRSITQQSLRRNIGVVAQETVLFNATLRENILYGKPHATEEEVWDAVNASSLMEFVMDLPDKLETVVGERGMKLSGGERQRVGLARCIIKKPKLILLDEATSALDSGTEKIIQRNVGELCRNRTTLMIAHRLSTARNADEILVLEKGRIEERGTHEELLRLKVSGGGGGLYAQMWHDQTSDDPK